MTDREAVATFMAGYQQAWGSNDPDDLRRVFAADVEYRFKPFEDPVLGVDALIRMWLEGRDDPDDFRFEWRLIALDGDTAVVQAVTRYVAGSAAGRNYDNLWVVRLDADGRAAAFTEWWMERPGA